MYGWLYEACDASAAIVTAGRRLARELTAEYHRHKIESNAAAWRTPRIRAFPGWLSSLLGEAERPSLPVRISPNQSRILWEDALRREIKDPLINVGSLVRQAREAWRRLQDWQVPLDDFTSAATGRDQHHFARAAARYRSRLESEGWIDDAMTGALVLRLVRSGDIGVPGHVVFAGFDRRSPLLDAIAEALGERGSRVDFDAPGPDGAATLAAFETPEAELRAAGAWARRELRDTPGCRLAIVATDLERHAARAARLVRDGLVPGWQYAERRVGDALNVSYGRKLADYPAIAVALLLVRWCHGTLSGSEISLLLRSPFLGSEAGAGRARLELDLRREPDRGWTPELFLAAFDPREDGADVADWLTRLSGIVDDRADLPREARPADWAGTIDAVLQRMGWPGPQTLDSDDFQLVDRWRDLLNELASLGLVSPRMSFAEAAGQVATMARDALFQPERGGAVVQLLGPLEAAGLRFDKLWVSGCTAEAWPPAGRPLPLLSRSLQQRYAMPDAEPADTTEYAERVLARLGASAAEVVFSHAVTAEDAEQAASPLLDGIGRGRVAGDPGWHAASLCDQRDLARVDGDEVPAVDPDEHIAGGAATLRKQLREPFAAFAAGRLGIRPLERIAPGITAPVRGNLLHAALFRLYEQCPTQAEILGWDAAERGPRVSAAVDRAFRRFERAADPVLREILALERRRATGLLHAVLDIDARRETFAIDAVERETHIVLNGVPLRIRPDRVDRYGDGAIAILDYKTGATTQFLRARAVDPDDLQLIVYSEAFDAEVAAVGLFNVGSREVSISGAGRGSLGEAGWREALSRWQSLVKDAASEFARGDVRLNGWLRADEARRLALLSRRGELDRDA